MTQNESIRGVPVPAMDTKPEGPSLVQVTRPALTVSSRFSLYDYFPAQRPGLLERVQGRAHACCSCSRGRLWAVLRARLPILDWLPAYRLRHALLGDVIAGVTVGVIHIPLGIGFAMLAGLPGINGLYMAFFPVLVYGLMGTSRHVSIGTFAVSCMMAEKLVTELSTENSQPTTRSGPPDDNGTIMHVFNESSNSLASSHSTIATTTATISYSPQEVAAVLALTVGMWQVLMGVFQLGQVICVLLSRMIISGFTTSVAFHVITSQLKYLLGISVPRYSGPFKAFYTYRDLCLALPSVNLTVLLLSALCIILLVANDVIVKPRVRKVSPLPVPIELLAVVLGTAASYLLNLEERHHVTVIGPVPTGLPAPAPPPLELLPKTLVDGFLIALISYTTTFSIAKILAQKQGYTLDATQELYAQGMSNAFGSLFSCGPVANSISRAVIQEAVGGSTQLASFVSCAFLLLVLYVIGPLFRTLPHCVLAAIIVVSLKSLLLQVNDLAKLWSSSRFDAAVWVVTFVVSIVVDLDYGLLAGVLASGVVLLLRAQRPPALHLGHVPFTDLYLDLDRYHKAVEVPGLKIFQFGGPLHFGNASYFYSSLFSVTGLDLAALGAAKASSILKAPPTDAKQPTEDNPSQGNAEEDDTSYGGISQVSTQDAVSDFPSTHVSMDSDAPKDYIRFTLPEPRWLVLDLSLVSFVDTTGAHLLTQLHRDLQPVGVTLCLASASDRVLDILEKCGVQEEISHDLTFHSTHDAVTAITCQSPAAFPDL